MCSLRKIITWSLQKIFKSILIGSFSKCPKMIHKFCNIQHSTLYQLSKNPRIPVRSVSPILRTISGSSSNVLVRFPLPIGDHLNVAKTWKDSNPAFLNLLSLYRVLLCWNVVSAQLFLRWIQNICFSGMMSTWAPLICFRFGQARTLRSWRNFGILCIQELFCSQPHILCVPLRGWLRWCQ